MTEAPSLTTLYTDLSDLPLYNWIEIATTSALKWLVKSGPLPEQGFLDDNYANLLAEYQSLVKDTKTAHEHTTKVTYSKLANRIDHVNISLNALRIHGADPNIIRILRTPQPNGLGFERLTYEDLERDITLTENFLKMDVVKFEQAKAQLEKIIDKAGDTDGVNSKGAFYEQITSLSKWIGFGISPKTTSVIEYISYLNMLQVEVKMNEKSRPVR